MRYDAPLSDFYPRIYYPFPGAMRFTRAISFCSPRFLYSFVFLLSYVILFKHLFPRCYLLGKWTNFPRLEIFNYAQPKNSYWILILYQKNNYLYSILLNNVEQTIKSAYPRSPYIYIYKKIATTSKDTLSKQFIRSGRLSAWFTYLNVRIGDKCRQRTTSPKSALIHFAHAAFGERLFHLPRPVHLRTPLQGRPSPNHYSWTRGHARASWRTVNHLFTPLG